MRDTANLRRTSGPSCAFEKRISAMPGCRLGVVAALALGSTILLSPATSHADSPVTVTRPWFRYIMPQVPAGGYMTVKNSSAHAVVLTGASSPACGMVMLHRSEQRGGVERMVDVPRLRVPAEGSVQFAPGGYHLMCMQPKMRPGATVRVTLNFQGGSTLTAAFPVYAVGRGPNSR